MRAGGLIGYRHCAVGCQGESLWGGSSLHTHTRSAVKLSGRAKAGQTSKVTVRTTTLPYCWDWNPPDSGSERMTQRKRQIGERGALHADPQRSLLHKGNPRCQTQPRGLEVSPCPLASAPLPQDLAVEVLSARATSEPSASLARSLIAPVLELSKVLNPGFDSRLCLVPCCG